MIYSYYKVGIIMNKKIGYLLVLSCVVLFGCTACKGNITRDIRHAGFNMGGTFACSRFYPKDDEDTNYDKIKYFTNSHVINQDGKLFELSLDQTFANKENCKEADTDIVVKAIYDDKIVKSNDNRYYYLTASNNVESYTMIPETDNSYDVYNLLLREDNVVKVVTANSSMGLYYVLKDDGNIYAYVISKKDYNTPSAVTSVSVVYNKNDYGAKILDFGYAGDSLNTFIRTEDKIFRMRITNFEKCDKYADVACEFQMSEDPIFNTYKDVIISFNGNILITNYMQTFTVTS